RAARAVVPGLQRDGHDVLNVDVRPSPESYHYPDGSPVPFLEADLTDYGQALEALAGRAAAGGGGSRAWWGPRARRRSACRSTRPRTTPRSTRRTCAPRPVTRCPRTSAR